MERKFPPSLKRYLVQTARSLSRLRSSGEEGWGDGLSPLDELVIVLEDRRYLKHHGLDWRSAVREFLKAITFRKHGGASTIEMQFVRTVTGRYERTLRRKVQEIILSFLLDYHLSKAAILHRYLSIAYFGTGIWGIENASKEMFARYPWQLTTDEAAVIAAMLVYPKPRNPSAAWKAKVDRRARYGIALHRRLYKGL